MANKIVVNPVTRIEGHAKVTLEVDDQGKVTNGHLNVLEIRGFEKLLENMELLKMPLVTARLCGVCPAAHHLASVTAIEKGLGIEPPEQAKLLRELMYMGHMLHSHALSSFVLIGPDVLLGIDAPPETRNVFHLLQVDAALAKKALRLRSIGQRIVELIGGRGVHPVTVIPGGMTSAPESKQIEGIATVGQEALGILQELGEAIIQRLREMNPIREQMILPFPPMALSKAGVHSFLEGDIVVKNGQEELRRKYPVSEYAEHLVEHVLPGSYMKTVRLRGQEEQSYFVGPLARMCINDSFSTPQATQQFQSIKQWVGSEPSALDNILARLVEMIHCAERIIEIAGSGLDRGPINTPVQVREGRYVGGIEAPRGILIHDYTVDASGRVQAVNFIVATQNNYDAMDAAVTSIANHFISEGDDDVLMNGVEFALRCFDPCLACATHVAGRMPLEVELRSGDRLLRKITRSVES